MFTNVLVRGCIFRLLHMAHTGYFDGGSRGNPGIAGAGYVLYDTNNNPIDAGTVFVGMNSTNNVSEYSGLIGLLEAAEKHGVTNLKIYGDSMLVINQITGKWQCSHKDMKALNRQAMLYLDNENLQWEATHLRRKLNKVADRLSNIAMNEKASGHGLHLLLL